jgi:hypothetical protein
VVRFGNGNLRLNIASNLFLRRTLEIHILNYRACILTIVFFCFVDNKIIFVFSGNCGCREEEAGCCRANDDRPLI